MPEGPDPTAEALQAAIATLIASPADNTMTAARHAWRGARRSIDEALDAGCSGGNCDRRAAYLQAAADRLVSDTAQMSANWAEGGPARAAVTALPLAGLLTQLTGTGSLSYGELAGERIRNVYRGSYNRSDGSVISGPAIAALVAADPAVDAQPKAELDATVAAPGDP